MVYFLVDGHMGDNDFQVADENDKQTNFIRRPKRGAKHDAKNSSVTSASSSSPSSSRSSTSSAFDECNVQLLKKNIRQIVAKQQQHQQQQQSVHLDDESDEDEIALYPLSNQVGFMSSFEWSASIWLSKANNKKKNKSN